MTQKGVIRELELLGYERHPRTRAPAILKRGVIEQRVYEDGSIETVVNGRLIINKERGRTNVRA